MTVSACSRKWLTGRKAIVAAKRISSPPIVGVPCLAMWCCGPSSRMCWPNSLRRRNSMKRGPIAMEMIERDRGSDEDADHAPLPEQSVRHDLEADRARALDEDRVARPDEAEGERRGLGGGRPPTRRGRSAARARRRRARRRALAASSRRPRRGNAEPPPPARPSRPESRPSGGRSRAPQDARAPRASRQDWRSRRR